MTDRREVQEAEAEFQRAKDVGDDSTMKAADHRIKQAAHEIGVLTEFKSGLYRFARTYAYIAQLLDLGDPDLESFAAFAKLLASSGGVGEEAKSNTPSCSICGARSTFTGCSIVLIIGQGSFVALVA